MTGTKGNEPVPALNAKGQPEADKPKHDEVESPAIREKREVANAVRSGTPDREIAPAPAAVTDTRNPGELSDDELAKQRFEEQVAYAKSNDAEPPEEGATVAPEDARIDGEPAGVKREDGKKV